MKNLTALLLAIAFMGPAFAQETRKAPIEKVPAEKPACCQEKNDENCEGKCEEGKGCCQEKDMTKKDRKRGGKKDGAMKHKKEPKVKPDVMDKKTAK